MAFAGVGEPARNQSIYLSHLLTEVTLPRILKERGIKGPENCGAGERRNKHVAFPCWSFGDFRCWIDLGSGSHLHENHRL